MQKIYFAMVILEIKFIILLVDNFQNKLSSISNKNMLKLKTNQYVIKNGQLMPKEKPAVDTTPKVIPYEHTVRRIYPNSALQYQQTIDEQRNQIQALKRQIHARSLSTDIKKQLNQAQRQNIEVSPFTLYQNQQKQQRKHRSSSKPLRPSSQNINLHIIPQNKQKKVQDSIFSLSSQIINEFIINEEKTDQNQISIQHRQSKFGKRIRNKAERFRSFSVENHDIETETISTQTQDLRQYFKQFKQLTTQQSQSDLLTTQRSIIWNSQLDCDLKTKSNEQKQHLISMLQSQINENEKYKELYESRLFETNQNANEIKQKYDKRVKQLNQTLKQQRKASLRVRTQLSKCQQEISEKDATILELIEKLRSQLNEVSNLKTQNKQAIAKQAQKIFKKVKGKQKEQKHKSKVQQKIEKK